MIALFFPFLKVMELKGGLHKLGIEAIKSNLSNFISILNILIRLSKILNSFLSLYFSLLNSKLFFNLQ